MKHYAPNGKAVKPHGLPHLRILRQSKGLSIGQLASMTGIRRDTISHFESGREDPQPYQLRLLAAYWKFLNTPWSRNGMARQIE